MPIVVYHRWYRSIDDRLRSYLCALEIWLESESANLPLYIPIFVGLGISSWFVMGSSSWPVIIVPAILCAIISVYFRFHSRFNIAIFTISLSLITGWAAIQLRSDNVSAPVLERPWVGHIYGRIDMIEKLPARDIIRLTLETDGRQSLPPRVRINLSANQYRDEFTSGSIIRSKVRLLPPSGPAVPGAYDFAQRAWFEGLGATGSALGDVALIAQSKPKTNLAKTRSHIAKYVREKMDGRSGAIGATLASGDRGAITLDDAEAMRRSGMAHLLAISGLHVTAVVMMSFFIIAKILSLFPNFALRQKIPIYAASFSALIAIFYTLLTGAQVPTIRACIAACLVLAALMLGREPFTLRLVAFGALFILLLLPEVLVGPSFQLSFAAVAAIIALHETKFMQKLTHRREEPWIKAVGRFMISLFITGLVIEITLAPIALYHFQKTGIYGALANMIAIPLTTFIIIPAGVAAFIFDTIGLGAPFWWICSQSIEIILKLAHYVSDLPGSVKTTANISGLIYGMIILFGLSLIILKTKMRLYALIPLAIAFAFLIKTPSPDILITGDGRHLAVKNRVEKGNKIYDEMLIMRTRSGDYIRELLNENAGFDGPAADIRNWPDAQCSPDICILSMNKSNGGEPWTILATKSSYFVPRLELAAACKRVDIAVSDRYLPYSCQPKRLKIDRNFQQESGGVAIYLESNRIRNVASEQKHLPWSKYNPDRLTTYPVTPFRDPDSKTMQD